MKTNLVVAEHVRISGGKIDILGYNVCNITSHSLPLKPQPPLHALATLDPMPNEVGLHPMSWFMRDPTGQRRDMSSMEIQINSGVNFLQLVMADLVFDQTGEWWVELHDAGSLVEAVPITVIQQSS